MNNQFIQPSLFLLAFLMLPFFGISQDKVMADSTLKIFNFEELEVFLEAEESELLVVNFWATWCKPCVEELHLFERVTKDFEEQQVKVILVSLDFKKAVDSRLIPFIKFNELKSEVVLLEDPRMNTWIDKVDESWTGAIPATWYITKKGKYFHEGMYADYSSLHDIIKSNIKN